MLVGQQRGADEGTMRELAESPIVRGPADVPGLIKSRTEQQYETARAGRETTEADVAARTAGGRVQEQGARLRETEAKATKEEVAARVASATEGEQVRGEKAKVRFEEARAGKEELSLTHERQIMNLQNVMVNPQATPQDKAKAFSDLAVVSGHSIDFERMNDAKAREYATIQGEIAKMYKSIRDDPKSASDLTPVINDLNARAARVVGSASTKVRVNPTEEGAFGGSVKV